MKPIVSQWETPPLRFALGAWCHFTKAVEQLADNNAFWPLWVWDISSPMTNSLKWFVYTHGGGESYPLNQKTDEVRPWVSLHRGWPPCRIPECEFQTTSIKASNCPEAILAQWSFITKPPFCVSVCYGSEAAEGCRTGHKGQSKHYTRHTFRQTDFHIPKGRPIAVFTSQTPRNPWKSN